MSSDNNTNNVSGKDHGKPLSFLRTLMGFSFGDVILSLNYIVHLIILYTWLIPSISERIAARCMMTFTCRRFLKVTFLGYAVDLADGQWRRLRQSMWLLWLAMVLVSVCHFIFRIMTLERRVSNRRRRRESEHRRQSRSRKGSSISVHSSNSSRRSSKASLTQHEYSSEDEDAAVSPTSSRKSKSEVGSQISDDDDEEDHANSVSNSSYFRFIVGIGFVILLHRQHALVVLLIAYVGFRIAKWQKNKKWSSLCTWLYALLVLLLKESHLIKDRPQFNFLQPLFDQSLGGMYDWRLPANFLVLRIISFSLDYNWALTFDSECKMASSSRRHHHHDHHDHHDQRQIDSEEDETYCDDMKNKKPKKSNENDKKGGGKEDDQKSFMRRRRSNTSISTVDSVAAGDETTTKQESKRGSSSPSNQEHKTSRRVFDSSEHRWPDEYNFVNYFAYILYPPLYMAGPIMSFNSFVEFSNNPQRSEDPWKYGIRWLLLLALMEYVTSRYPFFAVIQSGIFTSLSIKELVVLAYMTLKMMWLKFMLIWRFFRLWAMADGTLPPENMLRCMSNNYSLETFWRGWHSSFNKWIVRYMYKPLGGRSRRLWSVWPIFLFVAIWHDIDVKLLMWGALNSFFFVLEILAKRIGSSTIMRELPSSLFQAICMLAGATYIIILVCVNLLGYAVGVGGITHVLEKALTGEGLKTLLFCYYFLAQGVSFMNFLRSKGLAQP